MKSDADIRDGETADIYIAMLNGVKQIETTGELTLKDVEELDHKLWVWLMEKERKGEEV